MPPASQSMIPPLRPPPPVRRRRLRCPAQLHLPQFMLLHVHLRRSSVQTSQIIQPGKTNAALPLETALQLGDITCFTPHQPFCSERRFVRR